MPKEKIDPETYIGLAVMEYQKYYDKPGIIIFSPSSYNVWVTYMNKIKPPLPRRPFPGMDFKVDADVKPDHFIIIPKEDYKSWKDNEKEKSSILL